MKYENYERITEIVEDIKTLKNQIEAISKEYIYIKFMCSGTEVFGLNIWDTHNKDSQISREFIKQLIEEKNLKIENLNKELESL